MLAPLAPNENAYLVQSDKHSVVMSGNWLIRASTATSIVLTRTGWGASDSDLPFAFYRAYHRRLASYLALPERTDRPEAFIPPSEAIVAPGFLFLAASLLEKADSLVHRNLRSVTTLGPNSGANFSTIDSANLSTGAKPKVLEAANRRVVTTMLDIIGGPARPSPDPEAGIWEGRSRRWLFGGMLQVWLRAVVRRTSMYDARGIFVLLDFIEGLIYTVGSPAPPTPAPAELPPWRPCQAALPLFDVPFMLDFVQIILQRADNTVSLMRAVAFLYSQFETCVRAACRDGR